MHAVKIQIGDQVCPGHLVTPFLDPLVGHLCSGAFRRPHFHGIGLDPADTAKSNRVASPRRGKGQVDIYLLVTSEVSSREDLS